MELITGERPRELTPRDQQRVLILALWRRANPNKPNIGYGMAKRYVWLLLSGVAEAALIRPIGLLLGHRLSTRAIGCLLYLSSLA